MTSIINLTEMSTALANEISELKYFLKGAPEEHLIIRRKESGSFYYYKKICRPDQKPKEIYLSKKHRGEAEHLARIAFAGKKLADLQEEKRIIDRMLRFRREEKQADAFLRTHPGVIPLLTFPDPDEWKNRPYNRNMKYPEQLIIPTIVPNLMVRSKSEANIIARLEYFGVPYHYDEIILADDVWLAMDLKCMNRRSGKLWYWDHRGMMDNEDYIKKTLFCESKLCAAGIIPWVNLIVTTETREFPLDIQWVDTLIKYYLI